MSKISELSDGGSLLPTDFLIAVRSGGNVKVKADQADFDRIRLGDNEKIELGNSQDLTLVHTATQSIINQAGVGDLLLQKAGTTKASITANGLEFPDSSKAIFGADSDLQIYHDGSHSYIDDVGGTGNLKIRATNLVLQSAIDENYATFVANGAASLFYDNSTKLATTATGIDVTGSVTADGLTVDGTATFNTGSGTADNVVITSTDSGGSTAPDLVLFRDSVSPVDGDNVGMVQFRGNDDASAERNYAAIYASINDATSTSVDGKLSFAVTTANTTAPSSGTTFMTIDGGGDISFYEDTGTTPKLTWDASAESLNFADNAKAIFGAGPDLRIYHDGLNSYINDTSGTGNLYIASNQLIINNAANNENMARFTENDAATLYFDGSAKLATTATGIDVTGSVTADGLTVAGNNLLVSFQDTNAGGGGGLQFKQSTGAEVGRIAFNDGADLRFFTGASVTERLNIDGATGDISFYEDTGTTPKLTWDASAESLTLSGTGGLTVDGATTLNASLDVDSTTPQIKLNETDVTDENTQFLQASGTLRIRTVTDAGALVAERLRIDHGTGDISFYSSDGLSQALFWDASAESLGIGTSSPVEKLYVNSTSGDARIGLNAPTGSDAEIKFSNNAVVNYSIGHDDATDNFVIGTDNVDTPLMSVTKAGNVGIGTSSPDTALELSRLNNGSNGDVPTLRFTDTDPSSAAGQKSGQIEFKTSDTTPGPAGVHSFINGQTEGTSGLGALVFGTGQSGSASEAMRIDSSGSFYVGTTTTGSNVANGFTIQNPASATYTTLGHANGTASGLAYTVFSYNSGTIGSITQSGTTAVLYNTTSDQRLKENIADADDAGSKIDAIQVRKFDWKVDGSHQDYGMVAQELLEVAPSAVSAPEDSDEMMGVDYSKLVPMMLKEIQSLRARVAQLES